MGNGFRSSFISFGKIVIAWLFTFIVYILLCFLCIYNTRFSRNFFPVQHFWDNLYLACTACNQRHKENLFPLINPEDRATSHHDNIKIEKPIFINPGKEDPENFIQFNGEIPVGIDKEERGKNTIKSLALDRPNLKIRRLDKLQEIKILKQVLELAKQDLENLELQTLAQEAESRIEKSTSSKGEFSVAVKCSINNNFEFIL